MWSTALAAHAQKITVTGRVLSATGEAQPGATVLERGTTNGTRTGANGEYSLACRRRPRSQFRPWALPPSRCRCRAAPSLEVRLAASATDLGDVVVTGSRRPWPLQRADTSPVDVISAREIKAFAQTDVSQVLTYVAPSFQSARQTDFGWHRFRGPGHAARPRPRPGAGAGERQAPLQQALVNINGTVGRGSVGTDFNVIPHGRHQAH